MTYYAWQQHNLILRIYVQPRASRDEIVGEYQDELKIRITAPPVDGEANAYLVKLFSKWFGVRKDQVKLLRGETGRHKMILIQEPKKIPITMVINDKEST